MQWPDSENKTSEGYYVVNILPFWHLWLQLVKRSGTLRFHFQISGNQIYHCGNGEKVTKYQLKNTGQTNIVHWKNIEKYNYLSETEHIRVRDEEDKIKPHYHIES